ncbi:MAG: GMP reductase [Gammaproteobacteria bacterium]|nr:GMP reductase [Gammaproteobacteria bacterium]
MRIEEDIKLDYSDVLLKPKRSTLTSRKDVILERAFTFYHSKKSWSGIPIMTANMASCGTFEMARVLAPHKIITTFHKYYALGDYKTFFQEFNHPDYLAYTLGIRDRDFEQLQEMIDSGLINNFSFICLDVPNGYLERFLSVIRQVRRLCPNHIIVAGNVVSNEMTEEIILNGADIVKVGIGPGSACTTRRMTGVGYPQLSAVIECADAAHGLSNDQGYGLIIADGGLNTPGDISKALGGGADFTMSGSQFSGFEQSGGKTIEKSGELYKEYFGSSSNKAMKEFYGNKDTHRASEGRYMLIPHKGNIEDYLQDLFGSLRSTATYIGAKKLKEFPKRATFIRVNNQLNTVYEAFESGKQD